MRPLLVALLASSAVLLGAPAAQAGFLYDATWVQTAQGVPMTRTAAQLGAGGSSSAGSIAVSLSYPQFTTSVFVPKTSMFVLDRHIKVTQGGPQLITATPSMATGSPGIPGTVIIMTAAHVGMGVNQSMFNVGVNTLIAVPLSNGKAGVVTGYFTLIGSAHTITVDFYGWTPGTQTFTGLTSKAVPLPDVVAMGSFNLGPLGGGTVTLVSPSKVSVDGSLVQRRTVSLTTLRLYFFPEPGSLLILAAGSGAFALLVRHTRR